MSGGEEEASLSKRTVSLALTSVEQTAVSWCTHCESRAVSAGQAPVSVGDLVRICMGRRPVIYLDLQREGVSTP